MAVLLVVAYHAGLPIPGAFVGVDVFFVISGFVITGMLHREWIQRGHIRFGQFYLRRFKRLTPALAVMVSGAVLLSAVLLSPLGPQQIAAETAAGAMLLSSNIVIALTTGGYFDASAAGNPLLNTWSLSVEEQFYLVFPALLAVGWAIGRRRGWLRLSPELLVTGVAGVSFALAVTGSRGWNNSVLGFYSPFSRAWEFALGALLSLVLAHRPVQSPRLLAASGFIGATILTASVAFISDATPFPGIWTLLPVMATLLLILGGADRKAPVTKVLATTPAVKVGDWSYSIYLWHWPFIVFAALIWPGRPLAVLVAALASLIPALASYRCIEQPIRVMESQTIARTGLLIVTTVGTPLLLAVALWQASSQILMPRLHATTWEQEHGGMSCYWTASSLRDHLRPPCLLNTEYSEGKPVYLIGDSNAHQFFEGVVDATERLHRPLAVSTGSFCPPLDMLIAAHGDVSWGRACQERTRETLGWLDGQKPGTVVLSMSDDYWQFENNFVAIEDGSSVRDEATKASLIGAALGSTIAHLEGHGHQVVLIQTLPHFQGEHAWDRTACTAWALFRQECEAEVPLRDLLRGTFETRSWLSLEAIGQGASVYDFSSLVCPRSICRTASDGRVVYWNSTHIGGVMSHELADAWERVLTENH